MKRLLGVPLLLVLWPRLVPAAAAQTVPDFALLDQDGRYHQLARADGEVVLAFIGEADDAATRAAVEEARRQRGHAHWLVSARLGETREALQRQARALALDAALPLLHDEAQIVARTLGATRTGEWFALDPATRTVLRHGFTGTGAPLPIESATAHPISYDREIAPLIRRKCASCHRAGEIAPFAFSDQRQVKGWARTIQEVLLARRMPPWHADPHEGLAFANDSSLTADETSKLWRWIEQGAPPGAGPDPLAVPFPPAPEWPLGPPDYVATLPAPEAVPPTGVLPYQRRLATFVMPVDAWLRAAVPQPGNRAVVHHITVYADYPAGREPPGEDAYLTGWAPGMDLGRFPSGTGKFVPKGTRFRFEIHYATTGKPETDLSRLGLYVARGHELQPLETRVQWDEDLAVPPGEADLRTSVLYGFREPVMLHALIPHMHGRGSWMKYEALYPGGRRETLLSVPHYDFAWQTVYRLAEPHLLPAGTWLLVTGGFDNSARNPANLDPRARVRWGEQTTDEMFVAQFDVVPTHPKARRSAR